MNPIKCLPLLLFLFCSTLFSQNKHKLDSLWHVWKDPKEHDTIRMVAINDFIWKGYLFSQPDSALYFADLQQEYAKEKNLPKYEAVALNSKGVAKYILGEAALGIAFTEQSLKIREEIGDKYGIAMSLNNLGGMYQEEGNYAKAIDLYTRSLKIKEEIGDQDGIAQTLGNIGLLYEFQGNIKEAINYTSKALTIFEKGKNKSGLANLLNTMAGLYEEKLDTAQAMKLYLRSMNIRKEIGDKTGLAGSYNNIGYLYSLKKQYDKALEYHQRSIQLKTEIGDKSGLAISYSNLSDVYRLLGDYRKSVEYGLKGLELSRETGELIGLKNAGSALHLSYAKLNQYKEAYEMHLLFTQMKDSIQNEESKSEVVRKDLEYNYNKDKAVSEKEHEKEMAVAEEQKKKQRLMIFSVTAGLLLVLVFTVFVIHRLRITSRQKKIIEEQKRLVETQKREVEIQKHEVEHQKELVVEKQQEIIDSINYAKRLQTAILPPQLYIDKYISDNFVLYQPKDIVAGDFYWCESADDLVYIAAADSTGHGVPGAMVSIVCSNALNKALKEFGCRKPGEILDKTRELVLDTFSKSGEEIKDGMDVSLLCMDKNNRKISWSGANNPLWYVKDNNLIEIKADKQPVGKSDILNSFATHVLDWDEGTMFYLMTDGYPDQFGGEKGKKFKYKQLEELLVKISNASCAEQKSILIDSFTKWKGELEQVDDVTIIGIRV